MVEHRMTAFLRLVWTVLALTGLLSLGACGGGGGAPAGSPYEGGATPITVLPAGPTVYSGVATTLTLIGGSGQYTVFSSDASVLPITQPTGSQLILVANPVTADTPITLTIRDTNGQSASALVTVKPASLLPASITIAGNPICAQSNATLCSGQDGTATVVVTGTVGAPIAGRSVRFDVVLGTYSLIAANSTTPSQSVTVLTDQNGLAAVTLRVPVNAPTQFATLRATDVTTGSSVLGQFTIAQFINGNSILSVIPNGTTTFTGPDTEHCASTGVAAFYIFGGTPPYTVATNFPTAITISGAPVAVSGGSFLVSPRGQCVTGLTFAITDAAGRTLLTPPTVDNVVGDKEPTPPAVAVQPGNVSGTCKVGSTFSFLATGGTGTFSAAVSPLGATVITPDGATVNAAATVTGGNVTVSFSGTTGAQVAGKFSITVSSGSAQTGSATLTCN